jgi:hypothetical protein
MIPFLKSILGSQGAQVMASLEKASDDLASYITPRVIVSWLRQSDYGNITPPEGGPFTALNKSGYGYTGSCNIHEQDYSFEYVTEEHIAAIVTTACDCPLKKSEAKNLDLAKLAKTIDLLVKAQKQLQYERTQHVQPLEPEGFIEPDTTQAKPVAKTVIPRVSKPLKKIAVQAQPTLQTAEAVENGIHFKTGKPVEFPHIHSKRKTPNYGSRFGQDIEPSGKYISHAAKYSDLHPDWETGMTQFKNPLVIKLKPEDRDETYGSQGWKARLAQHFGAKGLKLSHKLLQSGYDGVVTVYPDGKNTSEIVDLRPASQWAKPKRKKLQIWKSETSRPCDLCGQKMFSEDKFVGCTCFKPLAKSVTSSDDKLTITLEFDDSIDDDAMLALIGALKHGR